MLVDDQPDMLDMPIALFRKMGYEVLSANNAHDALEILKSTPTVSVLFTDVVMPGMNGIELAEKAQAIVPSINIVLTSGYAPSELTNVRKMDAYQLVKKPYISADIMKVLGSF